MAEIEVNITEKEVMSVSFVEKDVIHAGVTVSGPQGEPLSVPPEGYYRVTNIYVRPQGTKLIVEYDDGT